MYGLVNKAIEQMVCSGYGEATWETVKQQAGVEPGMFMSMRQYPDDLTYRLVAAASETLGLHPDQILRAFGRYWMLYTAAEGYGELLKLTGGSLGEFLRNLPSMHARIELSFPHLRPPIFECTDIGNGGLMLHYYSEREGLAPMVVGLLEGLAERFETPIEVTQLHNREQGHDHDVFQILFKEH
jgi:hypothetical protein